MQRIHLAWQVGCIRIKMAIFCGNEKEDNKGCGDNRVDIIVKKREKQTIKPKKVAFMILYLISSNGLFNTKYLMTYIPLTTLGA